MKKNKLRNLLKALSPDEVLSEKLRNFDQSVNDLKKRLTETIQLATLDDVRGELKRFQNKIDFQPLLNAIKEIENDFEILTKATEENSRMKNEAIKSGRMEDQEKHQKEIESLRIKFLTLIDSKEKQVNLFYEDLDFRVSETKKGLEDQAKQITDVGEKLNKSSSDIRREFKKGDEEVKEYVDETRNTLVKMIPNRGGSANRQINVNSSVMSSRFTDINFLSDTAIRWVSSNDTTNRRVNIQASLISGGASGPGGSGVVTSVLSGTGIVVDSSTPETPIVILGNTSVVTGQYGSDTQVGQFTVNAQGRITQASTIGITFPAGSGITRVSSTISVSSTFAAVALTDYVAFANVGIALTLPTASSNNLYTVKNVSASSVLVIANEGIDDSASALMPTNYESLSFISNASIWGVV